MNHDEFRAQIIKETCPQVGNANRTSVAGNAVTEKATAENAKYAPTAGQPPATGSLLEQSMEARERVKHASDDGLSEKRQVVKDKLPDSLKLLDGLMGSMR